MNLVLTCTPCRDRNIIIILMNDGWNLLRLWDEMMNILMYKWMMIGFSIRISLSRSDLWIFSRL
jgi:hypothetical protein